MKDSKNLEACDYIANVNNCIISNDDLVNYGGIKTIIFNDNIRELHIQYKGKEYKFDLEKALKLLCKEIENDND